MARVHVNPLVLKLILVGEASVGKTNLLTRMNSNEFNEDSVPTIGVEFLTKLLTVENTTVKAQLWDTAGQERYDSMMATYYRKARGALLVYDISNRESFEKVANWYNALMDHAPEDIVVVLVGNKCDLKEEREVTEAEGKQLAEDYGMLFMEASAKSGVNVSTVFSTLLHCVYAQTQASAKSPEEVSGSPVFSEKPDQLPQHLHCCS